MALLDFIKNRQTQQPSEPKPQPETAKQMYAREAGEDRAAMKPLEQLPEKPQAQLDEIKSRMGKVTEQPEQSAASPASAPADGATSPEPQRQNMAGQDKSTPDLSPTSMQTGKTGQEKDAPVQAAETPAAEKTPTPSSTPDPTPNPSPRGRGGWER